MDLPPRQDHRARGDARGLSLLCLDGGGVRGLSSLHILQRIMEQMDPAQPPKPCECFDMICGTSTGGLIAIMLGRLKMSVADCIREYEQLSASVFTKRRHRLNWKGQFQGRFDHEALESGIKDLLRRLGLPEDELLKEAEGGPRFVCTMRQEISDIVIFPSYYSSTWGATMLNRVRIWEAARATSAATSFFEPCVIDGKTFADGGTGANNPVHQLWAEASSAYGRGDGWKLEDHLHCLVSVGTGTPSRKPFGPELQDVAAALRAIATQAESVAQTFEREHPHLVHGGVFFRFNVANGLQGIGLEAAGRLGEIEALTSSYCVSPTVSRKMAACAYRLTDSVPWFSRAILQFERRLYLSTVNRLDKRMSTGHPHVQGFVHCKAFQDWLQRASQSLICITSRTVSGRDMDITYPLAASLTEHIQATHDRRLDSAYVNCFWILDKPKNFRPEALVEEYRKEKQDGAEAGAVELVLEALFYQLFKLCPERCEILVTYAESLSEHHAVEFRVQMETNGTPDKQHLLPLLKLLLSASASAVLISVDGIDYLADNDRTKLVAQLVSLSQSERRSKTLLCGASSMVKIGGASDVAVVTDRTETNECRTSLMFEEMNVRKSRVMPAADGTTAWIWTHPVYRAFAAQPNGMLWIRGKPGSGKSVLANCIQRRLLETVSTRAPELEGALVGDWFYHRRGGGAFVRHESFLRSVLFHFLEQEPGLFTEYFQKAYRTMDPRHPGPWTHDILTEILRQICQGPRHAICIVDAMDEAESADILGLIKSISGPGGVSNASFIILSRPNIEIERHFNGIPGLVVEDENANDIKRIIDLGLESLHKSMHSLSFETASISVAPRSAIRRSRYGSLAASQAREQQTLQRIRDLLLSKAQGSILWVKLVLDKLAQAAGDCGGATLDQMEVLVNEVPEELAECYKQILEGLTTGKSQEKMQEMRKALMWISAAAELGDVTLESLWEALALVKDGFQSETLDDIWQKQMPITTYDELWRKIYSMCGPFIEIFSPGLSAEESQRNKYAASSIVQLMHQSVRDFFSDPVAAGHLHFTPEEATDLVHRQLSHYLTIVALDNSRNASLGPQKPQELVGRLSEQRLLQLALKSAEPRHRPGETLRGLIGDWALEDPVEGSQEELLVSAIEGYLKLAGSASHWQRTIETLSLGRLFYHACAEGLVTAANNLLSLDWLSLNDMKHPFDAIMFGCIYFAASRCAAAKVKVTLEMPVGRRLPRQSDLVVPMSQAAPSSGTGFIARRSKYEDGAQAISFTEDDRKSADESGAESGSESPTGSDVSLFDLEGGETKRMAHGKGAAQDSTRITIRSSTLNSWAKETSTEWQSQPWTVVLAVERDGGGVRHTTTFRQWCRFLDILCGSKSRACRPAARRTREPLSAHGEGGAANKVEARVEEGGVPAEDVEDAILASLDLTRRRR